MKDTLNSKIWNIESPELKINQSVRRNLLQIARDFIDYIKIKNLKIYDIILTGSIANYNWHSKSDIDLHIILDLSNYKKHKEFIKNLILSKKSLWNHDHEVKIYGFEVEIYGEDKSDKHISSGVYSLAKDEWIRKPEKSLVVVDKAFIKKKYNDKLNDIYLIIENYENGKSNYKKTLIDINNILERLREDRKSGLDTNGEYAVENLVYKMLRNNGHLQKLHDIKNDIYDKNLSIETKIK